MTLATTRRLIRAITKLSETFSEQHTHTANRLWFARLSPSSPAQAKRAVDAAFNLNETAKQLQRAMALFLPPRYVATSTLSDAVAEVCYDVLAAEVASADGDSDSCRDYLSSAVLHMHNAARLYHDGRSAWKEVSVK